MRLGELVGDFNINPIKNESTLHILGRDARQLIAHHSQPLLWSGSNPHERNTSPKDPLIFVNSIHRRILFLKPSHQSQNDDDEKYQAQAATRIITPSAAVGPRRKRAHKQKYEDNK